MAKASEKEPKTVDKSIDAIVNEFVSRLSDEHKMLVVLKAQLYGGNWTPMLDDLANRLTGKPYIFKLANRIKDDVARIKELQAFETEKDIDLAKYVELP